MCSERDSRFGLARSLLERGLWRGASRRLIDWSQTVRRRYRDVGGRDFAGLKFEVQGGLHFFHGDIGLGLCEAGQGR